MKEKILKVLTLTFSISLIVVFIVYKSYSNKRVELVFNSDIGITKRIDTTKLPDSLGDKKLRFLPSSKVLIMDDFKLSDKFLDSIKKSKKNDSILKSKER